MKVSLNTIKQYIDFELPPVDELVARINEQLGQVEEVTDLAAKYTKAVIVKVVEAEQHPDADRLRVCLVDDGGVVADVPRDKNGLVQVVCGAPNAQAGMFAVWLPPASTVPASFDDAEPFVLAARELRGVMSQGMLAAADELAIGTNHDGIVEVQPDEWNPNGVEIKPGVSFAQAFGLDDTILDIENKMFTHRPDCFGQLGVAREIAGIFGQTFVSPEWYWQQPEFASASTDELPLTVFNEAPEKVPRFMSVVVQGVTIAPSPLWLQCELTRLGGKPINNVVDATNYVMLLTAQPTHAYDYDKLRGHKLGARMARAGEVVTLLNDKTYELTADDIVIADGEGAVGLAGIMGGGDSEVSPSTTTIALEVASFDMYTLRKSSMSHGVFTDALTRFNKGQSPLQNDRVLNLLLKSILDMAGGRQASAVADARSGRDITYDTQTLSGSLAVAPDFINERLGSDLSSDDIATLLHNVEIAAFDEGGSLSITAPFWRTDIELAEDVVEEVGRLYGFDKLPRSLPLRSSAPASHNALRVALGRVRDSLSRAGGNELLTYSFVHENVLKHASQSPEKAFRLGNALSPDLQYYRLGVLPSLLDKVHMNIKAGYDEFTLFEIGKAHHKDESDDDGLPREFGRVAGVYASKKPGSGAPYFTAKRFVAQLLADCKASDVSYKKLSEFDYGEHDAFRQAAAPFDPKRASTVWVGERLAGVVGELKRSVQKGFKLPEYSAGFELFVSTFEFLAGAAPSYRPLSRFPSTSQDITLKTAIGSTYADIYTVVKSAASADAITITIEPTSIYQADGNASSKTTTFHLEFTHNDRTLTDADIAPIMDAIAAQAHEKLAAERI